jgi:hypothetical protein
MPNDRWKMSGNYTPWYIGWANCDKEAGQILREYYDLPDFLPANSESGKRDWIFMGTPGFGAPMHIDNVNYPSWQAQVFYLLNYNNLADCYASLRYRGSAANLGSACENFGDQGQTVLGA